MSPGQSNKSPQSEEVSGAELVGRLIEIEWPLQERPLYYSALVIAFNARRRQHKVIYFEDESIESLELGDGPRQRKWRNADEPTDPLVGARVRFVDNEAGSENWFDFMRPNPKRASTSFEVFVYARIEDPDPEEVSGPRNLTKSPKQYYRVIHSPNDYLTTVDLSSVEYVIVESSQRDGSQVGGTSLDANDPDFDLKVGKSTNNENVGIDDDILLSRSRIASDAGRAVSADVIVEDEDLSILETNQDGTLDKHLSHKVGDKEDEDVMDVDFTGTPTLSVGRTPRTRTLVSLDRDDFEESGDLESHSKTSRRRDLLDDVEPPIRKSRRHNSRSRIVADDDAVSPDIGVIGRHDDSFNADVDSSPATQDTRDDPVFGARRSKGSRTSTMGRMREDSDIHHVGGKAHDTESDEEKLGWSAKPQHDDDMLPSRVGDYISVDTGSNGPRRKAYVEAYLPVTGTHFVAFCDSQGGNMQIKLTASNHSVLGDKEAAMLTKDQARSKVETVEDNEDLGMEYDDDVLEVKEKAPPLKRSRTHRSTRTRAPQLASRRDSRPKQRGHNMKILGKTANGEIVSRCISVIWPNTKLVYVALVIGYSPESKQHMLLYMVDHCVEVLELKYREWELLARGKEPWNSTGMVGKRVYVWWPGEYDSDEAQRLAEDLFGEGNTKVAYEAYVLNYIGDGKYKILYPCNEDCEERVLEAEKSEGNNPLQKEWDLLDEGVNTVMGLPVIGWEG